MKFRSWARCGRRDRSRCNESTTPLSNIVSIDESPLLDGLVIVGTDDGLLQITEDGGKTWRRVEDFPGVPKWAYVADVLASPRDANVIFAALQQLAARRLQAVRRPQHRSRPDVDEHHRESAGQARCVVDRAGSHRADLLFAGTEFGLFFTVDGGRHWVQAARAACRRRRSATSTFQQRESDVVMATFGRGFWILDDYSARCVK